VLVYLVSDKQRTSYDISVKGVSVVNLWQTNGALTRVSRKLSYIINIMRFKRLLNKGDIVFTYGYETFLMWCLTHYKNEVKVFCEITEHPYVINTRGNNKRNLKIQDHLLSRLEGLFVITEELRNYFIKEGLPAEKIHIINMFVDIDRFLNCKAENSVKYIAYCGTVSFYKDGVDTLIKAFSLFAESYPDYKLYIIGGFENASLEEQSYALVDSLGISEKVLFTGRVSPDKMPELLCNAVILSLARPDNIQSQNGFPTKLGEYLATGNPVVVSSVGEIPRFIKHFENGFLCEPGSANSVAEQFLWIASHLDDAYSIGAKGKELCFNEFSSAVQSQKALKIMTSNNNHL